MSKPATAARRPSRGAYLLPSLITVGNMILGFYALVQTFRGQQAAGAAPIFFDAAAKAIGWAIVFDGWDGRLARMMGTSSDFGREFDSLADVVTFGVAPAFLAFVWGVAAVDPSMAGVLHTHIQRIGLFIAFLFLVCVAARLARFNIQTNPVPANPGRPGKKYFVGLPSPAGAGLVAAVVHFHNGQVNDWWGWPIVWLTIVLATALLMVNTWRYWSFKDLDLRRQHPFVTAVWIAALVGAIWYYSEVVLLAIAVAYTGSGVVLRLTHMVRRRKPHPELTPAENA
jgi:CDP-diacylglycerol--serine O-phosphatidyltransferase